ncbi:hypothetical protein BDA96_01G188500 [Sorghum bicolor]|uniref:Uncharacterized protein n=2 Tax=Sorghum bicolor TaxID=4558 RepID=A0A921RZQ3_SORBI|nr:hypothetical protein BDA96_01G188500 [Sorghum bicolor]OQU91430.1 hypothetical protein SORBI_3001G179680 [Sorghum bicolor]
MCMLSSPYCIVLFDAEQERGDLHCCGPVRAGYSTSGQPFSAHRRQLGPPLHYQSASAPSTDLPVSMSDHSASTTSASGRPALVSRFCVDLQSVERVAGIGRDRRGACCRALC